MSHQNIKIIQICQTLQSLHFLICEFKKTICITRDYFTMHYLDGARKSRALIGVKI